MKRTLIILSGLVLLGSTVAGQSSPLSKVDYPKIITPSPEAAALGKYGDVPVSLFSGTPQIQIPVYNYNLGDIAVNIGLSYNAGGNRVDDISTNVGLGWVLNAGGVITQTVLGIPDGVNDGDFPDPTFNPNMTPTLALENFPKTADYLLAESSIAYNRDLERDIYFFNFLGYSGKFVMDRNRKAKLIPANPNLRIEFYDTAHFTDGFVITDDKGVKYHFHGVQEGTSNVSFSCTVGGQSPREYEQGSNSWYLTKIEGPDKREIIFEYDSYTYTVKKGYSETEYHRQRIVDGCPDLSTTQNRKCARVETINGKRVKRIYTTNNLSKVEFGYSASNREDLTYSGSNAGNSLDSIKVYDDNTLVKQWILTHGYFGSGTAKRLKLATVKEDSKPAYEFTYDETYSLPEPCSLSQDHWGYYNGKTSNTTFIPMIPAVRKTTGADREGDIAYAKASILTKILYPTGGITQFEYEGHKKRVTEDSTYYVSESATLSLGPKDDPANVFFHFPTGAADVSASWYLIPKNYDDFLWGFIKDSATGTTYKTYNNSSGTESLNGVLPENVTLKLTSTRINPEDSVFLTLSWKKPVTVNVTHTKIVYGGLRLKSLVDYDSLSGKFSHAKYYNYNYEGGIDSSSVVLPESSNLVYNSLYETMNTVYASTMSDLCGYNLLSSSTVPVVGNGIDNAIGYRQVIVTDSTTGVRNGRGIYTYSVTSSDVGAAIGNGNTDWCKGFLLTQTDQKYDAVSQSYKNVKRLKNYYEAVYNDTCYLTPGKCKPTQTVIPNIRLSYVRHIVTLPVGGGSPVSTYPGQFNVDKYFAISAVVHLKQTDETLVDTVNNNSITTSSVNFYQNDSTHIYPTKREVTDSKGSTIRNDMKYAFDLTGSGAVYSKMITKNMVGAVLEETATNVTASQEIAKKKTTYQFWNGTDSLIRPYQVLTSLKGVTPETHLTINGYDGLGNIRGFTGRDGINKTYVWDRYGQYPIAEAVNADTGKVAFTSFETSDIFGSGGWSFNFAYVSSSYSITGSKSFNTSSGNITKSGLPTATYIVSYWGRTGSVNVNSAGPTRTGKTIGDWTYYEHEVTGTSITISGSKYVDEVRLYPKGAMMTSYTYIPLVGVSAQSDINGRITFYEYDSYNRLKSIKDDEGKILKRFDYKYKGANTD